MSEDKKKLQDMGKELVDSIKKAAKPGLNLEGKIAK